MADNNEEEEEDEEYDDAQVLETIQELNSIIAEMQLRRDELIGRGIDVDAQISTARKFKEDLIKAKADVDAAYEKHLQNTANLADAELKLYRTLRETMDPFAEQNPTHPLALEWKQNREELKKHFPKEEE